MKNRILFIAVWLFYFNAHSQNEKIEYGVLAGFQDSSFIDQNDNSPLEYTGKVGFHVGVFFSFLVNNTISVKPEILYLRRGGSSVKMKGAGSLNLFSSGESFIYASINESLILTPIILDFKLGSKFSVGIGPVPGYSLNREISYSNDRFDGLLGDTTSEKFDLSLGFDIGYSLYEVRLFTRYNYGLIKKQGLKTSIFQLGISYNFKN